MTGSTTENTDNSNDSPLVSVIMNCYNGEKYLREAINSVLSQSYQHWELIFWDNQSTDRSADILKSYDDQRIRYCYADAYTLLYEARKNAVEQARGEFLTFLDVDDFWMEEKIEKQVEMFQNDEVGLVYGNYIVVDEVENSEYRMFQERLVNGWVRDEMLRKYVIGLLTIMVRRSAYESLVKPFDSRFHIIGDFDLALRLSVKWKFDCLQDPIAYYRKHESNESLLHRNRFIAEKLTWFSEMRYNSQFSDSNEVWKNYSLYRYHDAVLGVTEDNDRKRAISTFISLPLSWLKIKLLLIFVMPVKVFKIKNWLKSADLLVNIKT